MGGSLSCGVRNADEWLDEQPVASSETVAHPWREFQRAEKGFTYDDEAEVERDWHRWEVDKTPLRASRSLPVPPAVSRRWSPHEGWCLPNVPRWTRWEAGRLRDPDSSLPATPAEVARGLVQPGYGPLFPAVLPRGELPPDEPTRRFAARALVAGPLLRWKGGRPAVLEDSTFVPELQRHRPRPPGYALA